MQILQKKDAAPAKSRASKPTAPVKPNGAEKQALQNAIANIDTTRKSAAARAGVAVEKLTSLKRTEQNAIAQGEGYQLLDPKKIVRSPFNREIFDAEKLVELTESVRTHGVMQPIMVRPLKDDGEWFVDSGIRHGKTPEPIHRVICRAYVAHVESIGKNPNRPPCYWSSYLPAEYSTRQEAETMLPKFEIIAGERRWRASQAAKLTTVPAVVKNLTDQEAIELQITENLQREDVRPIDEARAYQRLVDYGYSVDDLVGKLHRSKSGIYSRLKLLELPAEAIEAVNAGTLPLNHAEQLQRVSHPEVQEKLLKTLTNTDWEGNPMSAREAKNRTDQALNLSRNLTASDTRKAQFRLKGWEILDEEDARKIFEWGEQLKTNCGYCLLTDSGPGGLKWSELVPKSERPDPVLAISGNGKAVEIYRREELQKAIRGMKVDVPKRALSPEAIANRKLKADRTRHDLDVDAIVLKAEEKGDCDELWDFLLSELLGRQCGADQLGRTGKRRGVVEKLAGYEAKKPLANLGNEMTRKQKRGLVVELSGASGAKLLPGAVWRRGLHRGHRARGDGFRRKSAGVWKGGEMNIAARIKKTIRESEKAAAFLTTVGMSVNIQLDSGEVKTTKLTALTWALGHGVNARASSQF